MNIQRTKLITTVTITDPDSGLPVDVQIYKTEGGGVFGVDASYVENDTFYDHSSRASDIGEIRKHHYKDQADTVGVCYSPIDEDTIMFLEE